MSHGLAKVSRENVFAPLSLSLLLCIMGENIEGTVATFDIQDSSPDFFFLFLVPAHTHTTVALRKLEYEKIKGIMGAREADFISFEQ